MGVKTGNIQFLWDYKSDRQNAKTVRCAVTL